MTQNERSSALSAGRKHLMAAISVLGPVIPYKEVDKLFGVARMISCALLNETYPHTWYFDDDGDVRDEGAVGGLDLILEHGVGEWDGEDGK
uniref:Uncharacterized protein n=1 Tax=viral metagenome TaxID=1070528 RepID=A0A6M3LGK9_9ZZZZ